MSAGGKCSNRLPEGRYVLLKHFPFAEKKISQVVSRQKFFLAIPAKIMGNAGVTDPVMKEKKEKKTTKNIQVPSTVGKWTD